MLLSFAVFPVMVLLRPYSKYIPYMLLSFAVFPEMVLSQPSYKPIPTYTLLFAVFPVMVLSQPYCKSIPLLLLSFAVFPVMVLLSHPLQILIPKICLDVSSLLAVFPETVLSSQLFSKHRPLSFF